MDSAFLQALGQARPDPGGGAAAAHSAALGLALLAKVVQLEHRRQGPEKNPKISWGDFLRRVRLVSATLLRFQKEDVQAYFKLTYACTSGDSMEMAAALDEAVACPLRIMQQAQEGLAMMAQAGAGCALHLVADLLVACELLGAAWRGAHHIARANLPLMPQDARRAVWDEALSHTLDSIEAEWQLVRAELLGRLAWT
jgi:formiminotetrahydrofolate cyclodeaminase